MPLYGQSMQSFVHYSDPSVAVVAGSNASVVRFRLLEDEGETHHDLRQTGRLILCASRDRIAMRKSNARRFDYFY